jgi:hypothetical protein
MGKNDARLLLGMSRKHGLYCAYFCLSLCVLPILADGPLWAIALAVLNLLNAVRLINKVPLK